MLARTQLTSTPLAGGLDGQPDTVIASNLFSDTPLAPRATRPRSLQQQTQPDSSQLGTGRGREVVYSTCIVAASTCTMPLPSTSMSAKNLTAWSTTALRSPALSPHQIGYRNTLLFFWSPTSRCCQCQYCTVRFCRNMLRSQQTENPKSIPLENHHDIESTCKQ